jgi:hypothetical protein
VTRVLYARNSGRAAGTRRRRYLRQWSTECLRQPGAARGGGGRNMTCAGANFSFAAGDRGCHVRDSCFVRTKRGASCWDSSQAFITAVVLRTLNLKNLRQWSTECLRQPGAAPTGGGRNMTCAGANFSFAAGDRGCHVRDSCFVRTKRGASCWDSSQAFITAVVLGTLNLKNLRQWSTECLRQPGAAPTGGGRNMTCAGANFSFAAGDRGCHVRDSCFVRTKRGTSCWDSSLAVS